MPDSGSVPPTGSRDAVRFDSRLIMVITVYTLAPVMVGLDTAIVKVAQRTFINDFASTQAVVAWTMSAYSLPLAAVIPLTGWAANRFGTKRLALGSVLLFTLGSLLCAMARNIGLLIAFRAVQGVGGGILMPLTFTILSHEAGPARLGRALAIGGIPMFFAPTCGPILGGWLIDSFGWQSIFLINVPIGLLTCCSPPWCCPTTSQCPPSRWTLSAWRRCRRGLWVCSTAYRCCPVAVCRTRASTCPSPVAWRSPSSRHGSCRTSQPKSTSGRRRHELRSAVPSLPIGVGTAGRSVSPCCKLDRSRGGSSVG